MIEPLTVVINGLISSVFTCFISIEEGKGVRFGLSIQDSKSGGFMLSLTG